MKYSIFDKIVQTLNQAKQHNGNIMVRPEVILWPDPEKQWASVIPILQQTYPALLIYGIYDQSIKQGPAIYLKCMIAQTLPEANWNDSEIPIIYLPGISKGDLKNIHNAGLDFQPLMEYQYTGTVFTQENGKEWTILALLQNSSNGLGIKVAQDTVTKDALKKALPSIFQDSEVLFGRQMIDAAYINNILFPAIIPKILNWMCKGESALVDMEPGKKEVFYSLCKSEYNFEPDHKNIKAIAEKLGEQKNAWKHVWQHYANAPKKYPEIQALLQLAKPADLGSGMFACPEESWPQVNNAKEEELRNALISISKLLPKEAVLKLKGLEEQHAIRTTWVWAELGQAPLAKALSYLLVMAEKATEVFPCSSINEIRDYYIASGFLTDQSMRKAMAAVKTTIDKEAVKCIITAIYKPWLEVITIKFQSLIESDASIFTKQNAITETETFVLFVDAFRFELAEEFTHQLKKSGYKVETTTGWSAIPSITPTAKPNVSPIANAVSTTSEINEFRPQLKSGRDLQTAAFRDSLEAHNYILVKSPSDIKLGEKHWQEIGDIDTKGHEEQADMVKRINELFEQVFETIEVAFAKGIKRVKVVTDHGWLLLPGGLPKTMLNKGLTETRWGRCALIKDAATTDLLHLPWRWNPSTYIAYAPGITFFKMNEEYAHGGISIHECLVPTLIIENSKVLLVSASIKMEKWVNLACTISTDGAPDGYFMDIRTKYNDGNTSIVLSSNRTVKDNLVKLMVDENAEAQAVTIVLLNGNEIILDKKLTTVGG